jgi:regulatory protein
MTSRRAADPGRTSRSNASDAAARAWERAVRLLTARDRSEQDVRDRLAAQSVSASIIDATIARLYELRYLDDRRFARSVAEYAVRRGHGRERVRAQLLARGVQEAVIAEVLQSAFADEMQLARQALARRYRRAPQAPADRARAAHFLLRQGYPEGVVYAVLGEDSC